MSKAFTKEQDSELPESVEEYSPPPGGKNFLTAAGMARLQRELELLEIERNRQLGTAGHPSKDLERRVRYLVGALGAAEVVPYVGGPTDAVRFGATVQVRDDDGNERAYAIVGIDEADAAAGKISWTSPIAAALLHAAAGDVVSYATPRGERELEIMDISYAALDPADI